MGLEKDIENTETGEIVKYWAIQKLVFLKNGAVNIVVNGYVNKKARQDNKREILTPEITVLTSDFKLDATPLIDQAYELLKKDKQFSGSIDV